jgi:tRNA A37 threonylcarbamoyladenosine synthetase subunit TsaC/SUA5/YrdC
MLCALAADPVACAAIGTLKRRPPDKPLLLVIGDPAQARDRFDLGPEAHALIRHLWPGELFLRLPWTHPDTAPAAIGSPALVSCPTGTLGALAARVGAPLAAAVASISIPAAGPDDLPALTIAAVAALAAHAGPVVGAVIDGGICPQGRHATVVDCPLDAHAHLLREGTVHPRAVAAALHHPAHR